MSLAHRIARLERRPEHQPPPAPCPDCGHYPEGYGPPLEYRMDLGSWGDPPPTPEWCGTCGAQLVYAIEFDQAG